jgi:5-methyltetrahydropteroyltriglutamate--homocysteine methyltransferase
MRRPHPRLAVPPSSPPTPRFRAEHIGSLLRPKALAQASRAYRAGLLMPDALETVRDQALRDAVALQEQLGFEAVTDGEFERASYWSHLVGAVANLTVRPSLFDFRDGEAAKQPFIAPYAAGRLGRNRSLSSDAFAALAKLTRRTPKITLPSPSTLHFWRGRDSFNKTAYRNLDSFFAELAGLYRAELADLARLGCSYVQLDEVPLALLCDEQVRTALRQRGEDPDLLVGFYIDAINQALRDRPATMTVGLHMCRGKFRGQASAEGSYEAVAERVFGEVAVDHFCLEYDSPRAGDFAPLRFVAAGKGVVLGLVCSRSPVLEPLDALRRRVDAASRQLPLERLAVSPQCGFAGAPAGTPLTADDQKRKLGLVVELARKVWS